MKIKIFGKTLNRDMSKELCIGDVKAQRGTFGSNSLCIGDEKAQRRRESLSAAFQLACGCCRRLQEPDQLND